MKEIAVSRFKATCLAVLQQVRKTRHPVRITRFGKPVADIVASPPAARQGVALGALKDTARIRGDITGPATPIKDWDVLRS